MALSDFIDEFSSGSDSLLVVHNSDTPPLQRMIDRLFEDQPIDLEVADGPADDADLVEVVRDGETVAVSDFADVQNAVLLVNADIYTTGTKSLDDVDTPAAVLELEQTKFSVAGYPSTSKGKHLLVEISRYIEALALRSGGGVLHSGFQRLSRLDDERGTRQAYARLAETDLDVHVYGVPDWNPPSGWDFHRHASENAELRRGWFVVFDPDDEGTSAALVATSTGRNQWDGVWTRDPDHVADVRAYLKETY
jgi:DICT domain-containing protein